MNQVQKGAGRMARCIKELLRNWPDFRDALDKFDPWEKKDFDTELRAECDRILTREVALKLQESEQS